MSAQEPCEDCAARDEDIDRLTRERDEATGELSRIRGVIKDALKQFANAEYDLQQEAS